MSLWFSVSSGEQDECTCLIADDTDLNKTGLRMEFIGRVFSHVTHSHNLGYKMLALNFDDGKQMLNVDFSLHGEKGEERQLLADSWFTGAQLVRFVKELRGVGRFMARRRRRCRN